MNYGQVLASRGFGKDERNEDSDEYEIEYLKTEPLIVADDRIMHEA